MAKPINEWIKTLIRKDILAMQAYHIADASGLVKLDAMESPFPWPGELEQQWLSSLSAIEANRYPDPQGFRVVEQLRRVMNIGVELDILLGNGSDEIIQLLIQAVANDSAVVLAPEPGFVMYRILADINRVQFEGVPLTENFQLDLNAMLDAIEKFKPSIIFLAQPNNPTGNLWDIDTVEAIIAASKGMVVIDEAYMAFTESNFLPYLKHYPNVLVMRTLSKLGLAGMRLGFLVGRREWIQEINKIRLPYNINVLTQHSVEFALQHYDVLLEQTNCIREQRAELYSRLKTLTELQVFPSEANFILVRTAEGKAKYVFEQLKQAGVLIKCLDGVHPLLKCCLRITVGDEVQNAQLMSALKATV